MESARMIASSEGLNVLHLQFLMGKVIFEPPPAAASMSSSCIVDLMTTIDSIKWEYFNEQFRPAEIEHKRRNDSQFSNLLQQLWGTGRVLCHPSSLTLEAHWPLLQELDCVLGRAITLVKEVRFKSKDSTSRREHDTGEYYLEVFLDLRWWTWVLIYNTPLRTACHGEIFLVTPKGVLDPSSSRLPRFMQRLYLWWSNSDGYARHLPSYGTEVFLQETVRLSSLLEWLKTESGDITRGICSASANIFIVEGKVSVSALHARKPSWVGDELKVDLTQAVLGMSNSGLVIKCKGSGTEYALKRVQNSDQRQPVIARLCHPHIVQLMSYWRENGFLFLMMELMEGDFKDLIKRRFRVEEPPFVMNVVLDILLQIAKAMLYLHDMGLTHPHLKSSDVLFKEAADRSKLDKNDSKYLVKLGDSQFYSQNDFESMAQQNVYQFGLICLEVLSTKPLHWEIEERVMGMSEEPNKQFKEIQKRSEYAIPGSLTQCITRCLDGSIKFSEVVVMLLLAQLQVLLRATEETSPRSLDSEPILLAKHQDILSSPGSSSRFNSRKATEDLRTLIDRRMKARIGFNSRPFSMADATNIMYCVARCMVGLHNLDIVHTDLKASNVLCIQSNNMDIEYDICLVDSECSIGVVETGFFRAPEILQAIKDKDVMKRPDLFTKAVDVYGYGMLCYEILTGRLPFEGHLNDYDLVLRGQLPEVPHYVDGWARYLMRMCWQFDPAARPTFEEISPVLEAISKRSAKQSKEKLKGVLKKGVLPLY